MTEINQPLLEKFAQTAHDAGMPREQTEGFIQCGYIPQPKQCAFHALARLADNDDGPSEIGLGGARGGCKSHGSFAQLALDDCRRVPGLKFLYLRSIQKTAREAFRDQIDKILQFVPHDYNRQDGVLTLWDDSRIVTGGFSHENDVAKYLGLEYDGVLIEESTLLSDRMIEMVYGSVRSSKKNWRPRKYQTTNPGGIGHQRFKKTFVIPWRTQAEQRTRFVPSTYKDNAYLDKGYIEWLEGLTGLLARMWRDGDWDVAAGLAFPDFDYDRHVIQPFPIPQGWPMWRSLDYGWAHPFAAHWYALDPVMDRQYVIREIAAQYMDDAQQARTIIALTPPAEHITITYASPDMWRTKNVKSVVTTAVEEYRTNGLVLTQADNDRKNSVRKIHKLLSNRPDGKPGVQIFNTCTGLINLFGTLIADPTDPEDFVKIDANSETGEGGDDEFDSFRHGQTNTKLPQPPAKVTTKPAWKSSKNL